MTIAGKQWQAAELAVSEVRVHASLQMRADGVSLTHSNRLQRVLEGGGDLPAIKVARVGKALYVVDGFHRLEAHQRAGRDTVKAVVAKMSRAEAEEEARLANTTHGKGLSSADKQRAFAAMIEAGGHLETFGAYKPSRTIAAEMNYIYSHETIRKKLKALGFELEETVEFPHGYKAWRGGETEEADEDLLAMERAADAGGHLRAFRELFHTLLDDDQRDMLATARALVEALERGERTERPPGGVLDI